MFINALNYLALFVWGSFSFFVLLGLISLFYRTPKAKKPCKWHRFVIVSVASHGVETALRHCIAHTRQYFPHSKIYLLIDEGAELQAELKENNSNIIIVPKEYRHDLLAKGRAINYFIETIVDPSFWYSFIDDDNLVMDNKFLHEIPIMDAKGYVATNPVLKARPGRSMLAHLMDAIRYFDDLTAFRFFTGVLRTPLLGLHGELMTVKGSVLKEIGFAHHSYTEDFRFAIEIVKKGYKVWQSESIVSIKSPNTIRDLLKQRGRWYKGIISDLPHATFLIQFIVGWRTLVWTVGIFGSWLFAFAWIDFQHTSWILLPGGLYFWFVYAWGIHKQNAWGYLPIIPIFGIIEAGSFIFGIRHKKFEVINKN